MNDEPTPKLFERLRFLAGAMEEDVRTNLDVMPSGEADSTLKMCSDFREAADQLEATDALLDTILVEMQAATNQDLAADGAVGDEEGVVWAKIEAAAGELREKVTTSDAMPTGMTLEFAREASE